MLVTDQLQKAGDASNQIQANTININNYGIDEKRAREICVETYEIARKDFTRDAYEIAEKRVRQFEDELLPKLTAIQDALNAFADPSFQFLLAKAQRMAAATERDADYKMLAELLACRITKGSSRKNQAAINRAVEIIDMVDDDALCALTVAYTVEKLRPLSGDCHAGLTVLNNLFEKLIYLELPEGSDWIEHLDVLDAVRRNPYKIKRDTKKHYVGNLKGYSSAGIEIHSEQYQKALQLLDEAGMTHSILQPNRVMEDYVIIPVTAREAIKDLTMCSNVIFNGNKKVLSRNLTSNECTALESIWDLYTKDRSANAIAEDYFYKEWDSFPALMKASQWCDSISIAFNITRVGTILAHTNAKRCDNSIPELPLMM